MRLLADGLPPLFQAFFMGFLLPPVEIIVQFLQDDDLS
jgi:hypothetical protein